MILELLKNIKTRKAMSKKLDDLDKKISYSEIKGLSYIFGIIFSIFGGSIFTVEVLINYYFFDGLLMDSGYHFLTAMTTTISFSLLTFAAFILYFNSLTKNKSKIFKKLLKLSKFNFFGCKFKQTEKVIEETIKNLTNSEIELLLNTDEKLIRLSKINNENYSDFILNIDNIETVKKESTLFLEILEDKKEIFKKCRY